MDAPARDTRAAVTAAAEAYALALHESDTGALARLFHEAAHLYAVDGDGRLVDWPRAHFLERVGAREAGEGEPAFEIEAVDAAGPEMAHVRLTVRVPPRLYRDYLDFLRIDGEWRVIAKVFRVEEGPAL
jgi:hypothetical protein